MLLLIANGTIVTYIIIQSLMTPDLRNIIEFGIYLFSHPVTGKLSFIPAPDRVQPGKQTEIMAMEQIQRTSLMFNFMCLLDWIMGCSDMWLNAVWGMSMRYFFLIKSTFDSVYQVKHVVLYIMALMGPKGGWLLKFQSGMVPTCVFKSSILNMWHSFEGYEAFRMWDLASRCRPLEAGL